MTKEHKEIENELDELLEDVSKRTEKKEHKKKHVKKVEDKKKKEDKKLTFEDGAKLIVRYLLDKLYDIRYLIACNLIIYAVLFFYIPTIILTVNPIVWQTLFVATTVFTTMVFFSFKTFRDSQIMFGFAFFYLAILLILKKCTALDLYGITQGSLDVSKPWLDAVFVTCIIVFFQYIGILLVKSGKYLKRKMKLKRA